MFDARQHCGGGDGRLHVGPDDCDYVETDPAGRYGRFDDVLGKGAMKTVYRAFDELQGIEVAWNQAKICDVLRSPEALERLYSEVHLLSTLNHDSIIQFHASWVDAGKRTFNFITELFTSGTLREYRQRYRRVDIRAVKNWARQILHGLVYLHCHDPPVIHRDLKCDNIFVNGHLGQVKIGDLGLAAVLKGSQPAHSVIGTPEFMAPELYDEEYNELVDIYSFGMCVLEMITAEYPYSECSNPAQIYKKVTSGRLPDAFYRVRDPEAQRFIGRCLENVSNRSSAEDLLLDPFLQTEDVDPLPLSTAGFCKTLTEGLVYLQYPTAAQNKAVSTDMKITGKMNPDDDTIYLRVQIADKDGHVRNIYFPFDIISDTAIGVADEMVKELEITDRDPSQIAEVIDREITALAPHWKEEGSAGDCQHHVYSYAEEDGSGHHPFYSLPSPTSSQTSSFSRTHSQVAANCPPNHDWLQDMYPDDDDETISQISMCSSKYSYVNYNSCGDPDGVPIVSPRRQEVLQPSSQSQKSTRFCPDESTRACAPALASKSQKQCSTSPEPQPSSSCCTAKKSSQQSSSKLARNRSMVDVRSQLLHQSLVEEVNRRMFKTIGSMENIGFQYPCEIPGKGKKPSPGGRKKLGFTWGRS